MIEIQSILFDEQTITKKVKELADRISTDYKGKDLVLVCILKGAVVFMADLMRRLLVPAVIDFIRAKSYGSSTVPSRDIVITKDIETDIRGKNVLIVDTIIDTGETLHFVLEAMRGKGPASLEAVVLLDKKPRRRVEVPLAYKGFDIPDAFVVGYGVDCAEQYRYLPYIAVVRMNPDA
ncbi:MAG TPA: hypoxanthine phosphoribosyltransferase [Nitrospirota bacterium]|nr:hypoxanthine phosphoribosyltransferase [Nitrospirota bacterium]